MNKLDSLIDRAGNREYSDSAYINFPDIDDVQEVVTFYKLQRKAYRYARDFFALLSVNDDIQPELLPIVFRDDLAGIASASDNGEGYARGCFACGNGYSSLPNQAIVFIDLPRKKKPVLNPSLKQYIRHEVIHYYLWLNNLPFEDDTALFWAFCNIYDGKAYATMSEEEQSKYNGFIEEKKKYSDAGCTVLKLLAKAVILNDENERKAFLSRLEFMANLS